MKNNILEGGGGISRSFCLYRIRRKYVPYGFPIIILCNPGVHYETPCITLPFTWWGNKRETDHWGDPGLDGRIILRWIFGSWMWVYGLD
jgi:hypothetical protein